MGSVTLNVPLTQIPFISATAEKVKGLRWQQWDRCPVLAASLKWHHLGLGATSPWRFSVSCTAPNIS